MTSDDIFNYLVWSVLFKAPEGIKVSNHTLLQVSDSLLSFFHLRRVWHKLWTHSLVLLHRKHTETHRKPKMKVLARVLKEFDIYHVFILLRNNLNKMAVNQGLYWY